MLDALELKLVPEAVTEVPVLEVCDCVSEVTLVVVVLRLVAETVTEVPV
jgi:hypothetical protein